MSIPWVRGVRITHLSRKGQLTIPVSIIKQLGLVPGVTRVGIKRVRGGIALVPVGQSTARQEAGSL